VFTTGRTSFSFLRGAIIVGSSWRWGTSWRACSSVQRCLIFSLAMVGLAASILYSTSNVLPATGPTQYVRRLALALLAAVLLLFYYVLRIILPAQE